MVLVVVVVVVGAVALALALVAVAVVMGAVVGGGVGVGVSGGGGGCSGCSTFIEVFLETLILSGLYASAISFIFTLEKASRHSFVQQLGFTLHCSPLWNCRMPIHSWSAFCLWCSLHREPLWWQHGKNVKHFGGGQLRFIQFDSVGNSVHNFMAVLGMWKQCSFCKQGLGVGFVRAGPLAKGEWWQSMTLVDQQSHLSTQWFWKDAQMEQLHRNPEISLPRIWQLKMLPRPNSYGLSGSLWRLRSCSTFLGQAFVATFWETSARLVAVWFECFHCVRDGFWLRLLLILA